MAEHTVVEIGSKVAALAAKSDAAVVSAYTAILAAADHLGPFTVEAKQTSVHLLRVTTFAGVRFQRAALLLTIKAAAPIASPRIWRSEQVSKGRWHEEIKLTSEHDVDQALREWLAAAYGLAGPR